MAIYKRDENFKFRELYPRQLLSAWKILSSRYRYLSTFALCIRSHTASSAQIKKDFGKTGSGLSDKLSRMGAAIDDISFRLNSNYALMSSNVSEMKYSEWKENIPRSLFATGKISVLERGPQHNGEDSDIDCEL